jgi:GNAT superfamily N-acetyltransferase
MIEIRLAEECDIDRLKEIWRLCFNDSEEYIDFYFAYGRTGHQTLLLIWNGEVSAMLTMIPVTVIVPDGQCHAAAMQYAIGTHPRCRGKGFATYLIDYSNQYLADNHVAMPLLVPADGRLFDFYSKRGYISNFYIAEAILDIETIERHGGDPALTVDAIPAEGSDGGPINGAGIKPATPHEYNVVREEMLRGRMHVAYRDEEIAYQKKLSKWTGADIYSISFGGVNGCAAIERINANRVLVKELLMPAHLIESTIVEIADLLPAKEYLLRLPVHQNQRVDGTVRPFGMMKLHGHHGFCMASDQTGYLGIAFD